MRNPVLPSRRRHPVFRTLTLVALIAVSLGASAAELRDAGSASVNITGKTALQRNCCPQMSVPATMVDQLSVRSNCPCDTYSPSSSLPITIGRPVPGCTTDAVVAPVPPHLHRPCGATQLPTERISPPDEPQEDININNCSRAMPVVVSPRPCTNTRINRVSRVVGG